MNSEDDTRLQDLVGDAGVKFRDLVGAESRKEREHLLDIEELARIEELLTPPQKLALVKARDRRMDAEFGNEREEWAAKLETAELYKLELASIWEQKGALGELAQRYRETVYDYEAGREILVKPDLEHQKRRMEEALWDLAREAYNDLSDDYTEENS